MRKASKIKPWHAQLFLLLSKLQFTSDHPLVLLLKNALNVPQLNSKQEISGVYFLQAVCKKLEISGNLVFGFRVRFMLPTDKATCSRCNIFIFHFFSTKQVFNVTMYVDGKEKVLVLNSGQQTRSAIVKDYKIGTNTHMLVHL